ncbi:MAG: alpha/beta fold hydrolase [Acidimicrobiales bacterium]
MADITVRKMAFEWPADLPVQPLADDIGQSAVLMLALPPQDFDDSWRQLVEWHLAEEIEHRTVTFNAYEHVCGGYFYRTGRGLWAQRHFLSYMTRLVACFEREFRPGEKVRTSAVAAGAARRLVCQGITRRYGRTLSPRYDPAKIEVPAAAQQLLDKFDGIAASPSNSSTERFSSAQRALASSRTPMARSWFSLTDSRTTTRPSISSCTLSPKPAIAPLMRGYEPSSQPPDGDYSLGALAGDVEAWIDCLGVDKVHLVGHGWGAGIAYLAGALTPDRLASLTVMAVPPVGRFPEAVRRVPTQVFKSWYMMFFQLPRIAEAVAERKDWALIRWLWKRWSPGLALSEDQWASLRATFEGPGVTKAMLGYYRANATPGALIGCNKTEASRNKLIGVPTLGITGADDGCIDSRLFDHLFHVEDFPAGFRVERLVGAGHFIHREQPTEVTSMLLGWFEANSIEPATSS